MLMAVIEDRQSVFNNRTDREGRDDGSSLLNLCGHFDSSVTLQHDSRGAENPRNYVPVFRKLHAGLLIDRHD